MGRKRKGAPVHGWVAFVIMPVLALANAGVRFDDARLSGGGANVLLGVAVTGIVASGEPPASGASRRPGRVSSQQPPWPPAAARD